MMWCPSEPRCYCVPGPRTRYGGAGGAGRPKCQAGLGMGSWRRLRSAHLWILNYCRASPTLTSIYANIHISTSLHLLVESATSTFTIYELFYYLNTFINRQCHNWRALITTDNQPETISRTIKHGNWVLGIRQHSPWLLIVMLILSTILPLTTLLTWTLPLPKIAILVNI